MEFDLEMTDALLSTTRAVRKRLDFDRPVSREVIEKCLELAVQAPTASNSQTWRWVIVDDADKKKAIADLYRKTSNVYLSSSAERAKQKGDEQTVRVYDSAEFLAQNLERAPVFVIPCYTRNLKHRPVGRPQISVASYYGSVYPAVQNLLLGCRAVGLGASLQTLPIWCVPVARRILGLPRTMNPVCIIPIGWARGKYGPTTRRPIGEVVHLDRYGNQPFAEARIP